MIIEAGYDILELLDPKIFADDASRAALWLFAMDEDLRYLFIRKVRDDVPEALEEAVPDIASALQEKFLPVRYYVLAHMLPRLDSNIAQSVHDQDELIRSAPALAEYQLFGRTVYDGEYVYSSAPRYSFRDYIGNEHLPRAAVIPGPHEFDSCTCLACTQFEERRERNRRRHAATIGVNEPVD